MLSALLVRVSLLAKPRLLVAVAVLAAAGVCASAWQYYRGQTSHLRTQAHQGLQAIADLKIGDIASWRKERLADAAVIFANPLLMRALDDALAQRPAQPAGADLRRWMKALWDEHDFRAVFLVNAAGSVVLSQGGFTGSPAYFRRELQAAVTEGRPVLSDLHRDDVAGQIHLDLIVPVLRPAGSGALFLRIDPERKLFPLVRSWPTPSRSGETLLVRREGADVLYLNGLRHRPGAALSFRLPLARPGLPAAAGLSGASGILEGRDYRGVPVLAAVRPVPGTRWVMVSKVDIEELEAPIRAMALKVGGGAAVLVFTLAVTLALLWRTRTASIYRRRYEERTEAEARLRAAKQALARREAQLRTALALARLGQWEWDVGRRTVSCSPELCETFGLDLPDPVPPSRLLRVVHPEDRRRLLSLLEIGLGDSRPFNYQHRLLLPDGTERVIRGRALTLLGPSGKPEKMIGVAQDITDSERAEQALRETQKLESLGLLAGGIAHDFNNLLTGVIGNASLLLEEDLSEEARDRAVQIVSGGERAAELTRQLLAYSGKGQFLLEELDLSERVRDLLPLFQLSSSHLVPVEVRTAEEPLLIRADANQVQQVVMNLVLNAAEAVPPDSPGCVTIRTWREPVITPFEDDLGQMLASGEYAVLEVADTGAGMDEETRRRCFEPFFSTKAFGRGLGLPAVFGIVRASGGGIQVESEPGGGSRLRVFLPAVPRGARRPVRRPAGRTGKPGQDGFTAQSG